MIDPTPSQAPEIIEAAAVPQPQADYDVTREVGYYQLVWRRLRRHRMAMISAGVLVFLTLASFIVPSILATLAPNVYSDTPDLLNRFGAPSWPHIMGTDELGRDIFRRILQGGQISLMVGLFGMMVTVLLGGTIGAVAGYFGSIVDNILMRITDAMLTIPQIFLLILIATAFGGSVSPTVMVLAIGLTLWPYPARIIRSVVLSIKEKEFVEAARAVGSKQQDHPPPRDPQRPRPDPGGGHPLCRSRHPDGERGQLPEPRDRAAAGLLGQHALPGPGVHLGGRLLRPLPGPHDLDHGPVHQLYG